MSKFDALALQTETPARMVVVHPISRQPLREKSDDDSKPGREAYIDLYSGDSEQARRHYRAVTRRRLALKRAKISPEEIEAEAIELLCALTAGWHLLDLEGKPLDVPFNAENARELYGMPAIAWLRDQVDEYIGDRGNFSKASSTN